MSRFYDALKEASRTRPTDGVPRDDEWEALTTSLSNVPVMDEAAVREPEPGDALHEERVPPPDLESLHKDLLDLVAIPREEAVPPPNGTFHVPGEKAEEAEPFRTFASEVPVVDHTDDQQPGEILPERGVSEPKLAVLPNSTLKPKNEIAFDPSARLIPHAVDSAVLEHYRRLRTKILQQHAAKPFQRLLVTSPNPQEGKTVTVLNLGLSFAMLPDFKVLVIDGDLRRGSIGKWLGVDAYAGLSDLLEGTVDMDDVILKGADIPLHVLTRGNSKVSPAELLHSPRLAAQFRRMTEHFDLVLVDSPPVTLITDAQLLGGSCDAVLLVARAFATTRKSLEQAVQELSTFRLIGTVLNGGTRAQLYDRYKGYY